jgi:hypothetical protein
MTSQQTGLGMGHFGFESVLVEFRPLAFVFSTASGFCVW